MYHKVSKNAADAFRRSQKAVKQAPVIPEARPAVETIAAATKEKKLLRTAYYARVSTAMDSQQGSIESQQEHFEEYIRSDPELTLAGGYVDHGISGTKAEARPELQRLLSDCEDRKIDFICTKSISRFARNTTDLLETVRKLSALGIPVWFEEDNIRTDSMTSEFMMTLLASIAENESHSISGNMKWGLRKRMQDGTYKQAFAPYGYEWDGERNLAVAEKEAAIVRRVFNMVLSGNGMGTIAKMLNGEKIPSPNGGEWVPGTLRSIVTNRAYAGDALYQKSFKDENFVQLKNKGELDMYLEECHHEAIISREVFDKANAAIKQRGKETGYGDVPWNRGGNRYCFTGKLKCKACGTTMHRQVWSGERPCWICQKHSTHPDLCGMKPQRESDLKRAFINCMNKLAWSQKQAEPNCRILDLHEKAMGKTEAEKNAERLEAIEKELEEVKKEGRRLNAVIMKERFLPKHREKKAELTVREKELMAEKNAILIAGVPKGTLQGLKAFLRGWKITDDLAAFPEKVFTEYVTGCTVNSGKMVIFHFKCGLDLTESLYRSEEQ